MDILDTNAAASSLAVEGNHPGAMLGQLSVRPFAVPSNLHAHFVPYSISPHNLRWHCIVHLVNHLRGSSMIPSTCFNSCTKTISVSWPWALTLWL